MKKPIGEVSADTLRLESMLQVLEINEVASYAVLSAAIGRNVQEEGRGNLLSARNRLLREQGMVFQCDPGIGVKRLCDAAIVGVADSFVRGIRRKAVKGVRIVTSVNDFDALSADIKLKHNMLAIVLGTQAALAGRKGKGKLLKKIKETQPFGLSEVRAVVKGILEVL
jgi:hypothetical protein